MCTIVNNFVVADRIENAFISSLFFSLTTVIVKQFPLNEVTYQLIEKVMKSKCRLKYDKKRETLI